MMCSVPKVTVAIPVYNVEAYVARCIKSVLNQDYQNIEILVTYDISDDNSLQVVIDTLKQSTSSYTIIKKTKEERGIGKSRNIILDSFQGDYLYFLDSDDYIEPFTISLLVQEALRNNADIVAASHINVDEEGNVKNKFCYTNKRIFNNRSFQEYVFVKNNYFSVYSWNKLYKSSFISENNLRYIHDVVEDAVFSFLEIKKTNKIVLLPDITLNYLVHSSSITNALMYNDLSLDIAKIYIFIRDFEYLFTKNSVKLVDKCSDVDAFIFAYIMTVRTSYKSGCISIQDKLNLCGSAFLTPKIPIQFFFQLLYSKKANLILLLVVKLLPFKVNMLLVKLYHKIKNI